MGHETLTIIISIHIHFVDIQFQMTSNIDDPHSKQTHSSASTLAVAKRYKGCQDSCDICLATRSIDVVNVAAKFHC